MRALAPLIFALTAFLPFPVLADAGNVNARLSACFARLAGNLDTIAQILDDEGAPPELIYLACAESTGDATACSDKGACGLWQLMPATARRYGLRVDAKTDERLNVEKSTRAAARYMAHLLAMFDNDPPWAVAAYNTGGHNLKRATKYKRGMDVKVVLNVYPAAYALAMTFKAMRETDRENRDAE